MYKSYGPIIRNPLSAATNKNLINMRPDPTLCTMKYFTAASFSPTPFPFKIGKNPKKESSNLTHIPNNPLLINTKKTPNKETPIKTTKPGVNKNPQTTAPFAQD
jgi:hypothetical protein